MFAATGLDLWENRHLLSGSDGLIFAIGFVVAFASALVVVRWLVRFVSHRSFDVFAWYRIVFGLALVAVLATGRSWIAKQGTSGLEDCSAGPDFPYLAHGSARRSWVGRRVLRR